MLQDRHAPRRREIPAKSRQIYHLLMRQRLQLSSLLRIGMALFR
jgi:hypothetical protein